MKYVIDCSVQIKTFVTEADSAKAIQLGDEFRAGIHELLAPDFLPIEAANVLMILERGGKIRPGDANLFFAQFLIDMPVLHTTIPLLPRALEIAKLFRQSVYDSVFTALAERESANM